MVRDGSPFVFALMPGTPLLLCCVANNGRISHWFRLLCTPHVEFQ